MPVIETRTVNGRTLQLKKYATYAPEADYEYWVEEKPGRVLSDPVYSKTEGMNLLREAARKLGSEGRWMHPSGGGKPKMPDFDDADDDDFNIPGL